MKKALLTFLVIIFSASTAFSQDEEVNKNLRLFAHGKISEVKNNIPELIAQYPQDPGVKLLLGVVLDDAGKALKLYDEIIKDHAKSQWADDAYWRIVQYYAVVGDTAKARRKLENFRRRYPTSEFLAPATDVVRSAVGIAKSGKKDVAEVQSNIQGESTDEDGKQSTKEIAEDILTKDTVRSNTNDIQKQAEEMEPADDPVEKADEQNDAVKEINADDAPAGEEEYTGYYGLQVGIYKNKESAEKERERFLVKRLRTEVTKKNIDGETMFAVVIGNYTSKESAQAAKMIVKQQCDCDPIIYKKKKSEE